MSTKRCWCYRKSTINKSATILNNMKDNDEKSKEVVNKGRAWFITITGLIC